MHPVIIQALAEERNRDMQACAAEARRAQQARHAGRARRAAPRPAPGVLSLVGTALPMHLPCLPWRLRARTAVLMRTLLTGMVQEP